MTTDNNKEIGELVETAIEWLAQRDPRLVPAEIAYHKTYKDHLAGLVAQAHQAGYASGYEQGKFDAEVTAEYGEPEALQDNK